MNKKREIPWHCQKCGESGLVATTQDPIDVWSLMTVVEAFHKNFDPECGSGEFVIPMPEVQPRVYTTMFENKT